MTSLHKKLALLAVLILTIGLCLYFYFQTKHTQSPQSSTYPPVKVALSAVKMQILPRTLSGIGELEAARQVQVASEVAGRIDKIYFQSGQYVKQGQLLIQLNSAIEQGELTRLKAKLKQMERSFQRTEELIKVNAISREEADNALASRDMTRAEIQELQARVDQKSIRAPFSGTIGIRQIHQGQYLQAGQSIANLVDTQQLNVNFNLDEQLAAKLQVGQKLQLKVDAYPEQAFNAIIQAIDPMISKSRTIQVQAKLTQISKLKPGMYAQLQIDETRDTQSLLVPETAITYTANGTTLFIARTVNNQLIAQRIAVDTGERKDGWVEITSGLQANDQVVVSGQVKLNDGTAIVATTNTLEQPMSSHQKTKL